MEKEKYFLDIAHVHPVCPLSLSHARIFVLADVWARWKRKQGYSVRFPICMHYSGSTVFKITNVVSKFLQKQRLNDAENKVLKLVFDFYKIPTKQLYKLTDPIDVLDYFGDVILKDLKDIQVSCDYDDYFNTNSQLYREFVRSIFDIYAEKRFIVAHNKSLNYSNSAFRNPAIQRLNKTDFSPDTAKTMVAESLEKLDEKWSFARNDSIGTSMNGCVIDPMFDAEFLSIFNAIFPYLKDLLVNESNARALFTELIHKIEDPDQKISSVANKLYRLAKEVLPVDIFFIERHLQNWVAKRIYTETILSPSIPLTRQYFFLGSITKDGQVDSASRGYGMTLSQLINAVGPETARVALLLSFGTPHRDYEWDSTPEHAKGKLKKINDFLRHLRTHGVGGNIQGIASILQPKRKEVENFIERGNIRKVLLTLLEELPEMIKPMLVNSEPDDESKELLSFFNEYFGVLCPSLSSEIYEK